MKMKSLLLAAVAAFAFSTAAFAADPVKSDRAGFYIAGNVGSAVDNQNRVDLGLGAGYQFNKYVRVEADYDHAWRTTGVGDLVTGNLIGQYRIPNSTVTPYALAGAGVGFNGFGELHNGTVDVVYNVGLGARIDVSQSVELDVRYRHVQPFNASTSRLKEVNLVNAGLDYRF